MSSKRPNILMLWTDEQRCDTMACYGNDFIRTPHLNRLADESFVFEQAYCCQPVCTPSRGCIMTGTWPHQHGAWHNNIHLRPEAQSIAEMLSDDYRCAYYGKWHLGDEIIAQHGFGDWKAVEDSYHAYYTKEEYQDLRSPYHHFLVRNGFMPMARPDGRGGIFPRHYAAVMAEQFTKPAFLAQEAEAFIGAQAEDKPWFLCLNFLEPHMPFFGPLNDMYDQDEIPVGPKFGVLPEDDHSVRSRAKAREHARKGFEGKDLKTDWGRRRLLANYYGLVSLVDNAVGRILAALEGSGQADNTIVLYTSDHGEMMGDHCSIGKGVMYEQSVRIPWLMRVPWLGKQQQKVGGRISQIDLAPTLLELTGHERPAHLMGDSRADVLRGEASLDGNDVFFVWNDNRPDFPDQIEGIPQDERDKVTDQNWRCMVSGDGFKLNTCETDRWELFDLNEDPHEFKNLIDDPAHKGRVDDMTQRIKAWMEKTGDSGRIEGKKPGDI